MNVNEYLESAKAQEIETKKGKIKIKNICKTIATVLVVGSIALSVTGCGNDKKNVNANSPVEQVIYITDSKTPYYDSLKENKLYFQTHDDELTSEILHSLSIDQIEVINNDVSTIKEEYAKYLYGLTSIKNFYEVTTKYINESTNYKDENNYNDITHNILFLILGNSHNYPYIVKDGKEEKVEFDQEKYSKEKYGTEEFSFEQMNINLEEIFTKNEFEIVFNLTKNNLSYIDVINDLFKDCSQDIYKERISVPQIVELIKYDKFTDIGASEYEYNLNSDVILDEEQLNFKLREWTARLEEAVLKSKITYGEYTKDGVKETEKPKVLTK